MADAPGRDRHEVDEPAHRRREGRHRAEDRPRRGAHRRLREPALRLPQVVHHGRVPQPRPLRRTRQLVGELACPVRPGQEPPQARSPRGVQAPDEPAADVAREPHQVHRRMGAKLICLHREQRQHGPRREDEAAVLGAHVPRGLAGPLDGEDGPRPHRVLRRAQAGDQHFPLPQAQAEVTQEDAELARRGGGRRGPRAAVEGRALRGQRGGGPRRPADTSAPTTSGPDP